MGILAPALARAKRSARGLVSSWNQRQVLTSVFCYGADQNDRFPESVATLGTGLRWSWREPTVLIGFQKRSPLYHRSTAEYLGDYIDKAQTVFCPSAPSKYAFAQEAWEAGDAWDHPSPDTAAEDPLFGNYCLYWNYVGCIEGRTTPFVGPRSSTPKSGESKLLISDYFGYDHWRNELTYGSRKAYGSCQPFRGAQITAGTSVASDFWSVFDPDDQLNASQFEPTLRAGYIDGHVERFSPADTAVLKVSMTADGKTPYPDGVGPAGTFYIPRDSW